MLSIGIFLIFGAISMCGYCDKLDKQIRISPHPLIPCIFLQNIWMKEKKGG